MKMKFAAIPAALLAAAILLSSVPRQARAETTPAAPVETPQQKAERMKWFREAKFGMFIHWGVYSVLPKTQYGKAARILAEWFLEETHMPVLRV